MDSHDRVVVAGNTRWTIPSGTLVGKDDAFVIMFDANGDDVWVKPFGSLENDVAAGVAPVTRRPSAWRLPPAVT